MLADPVDVLWTARYDYPVGWQLSLHSHAYYQMIYVIGGEGEFLIEGARVSLAPRLLLLIRPNAMHGLTTRSEVKTLDVKFCVRRPRLQRELDGSQSWQFDAHPSIPGLFDAIRNEGEDRGPLYRQMCGLYLQQILLLYLRQKSHRGGSHQDTFSNAHQGDGVVQRATRVIRERYAEDLSIAALAQAVGCSQRALRGHFQEALGCRPLHYIQRFRVERAKELIQYSDYTLKEVAGLTGFKTIHHFCRVFLQAEGLAPGAWRRKYREGIRKDVCINPRFSNPDYTLPPGSRSAL